MIQIQNLTITYPGRSLPVIHRLSLDLHEREWVAIIGANGSGKTTLLHAISGLVSPTEGDIQINGLSICQSEHLPKIRQHIGLVFQNPDDQIISATVEREIAFGLENLGVPTIEMHQRVDGMLHQFNLTHLRTRAPHQLSGGEKQRLSLAAIAAMRPTFLLLDEPTALLDPNNRHDIIQLLCAMHREGSITPILVTQHIEETVFANRIIVLHQGQIVLDGSPATVFSQPQKLTQWGLQSPLTVQIATRLNMQPPYPLTLNNLMDQLPTPQNCNLPPKFSPDPLSPIVTAQNLSYHYDRGLPTETIALKDLTLTLYARQITALIGQNGSGKSTFFQHLNGLLKPVSGHLTVCDIPVHTTKNLTPLRRRVGLIFQFPEAQLFAETVFDDVAYGPRNLKLSDIKTRVHQALETVGIDPNTFCPRDPLRLSGGEKRRVAIAGIIAMQPDVLIFDEPTAGLDPSGVVQIEALIQAQKNEGRTVLFITHDLDLAARLADHIAVFHQGHLHAFGPPENILTSHILDTIHLPPPEIVQITNALRQKGHEIPHQPLTIDAFCALFAF